MKLHVAPPSPRAFKVLAVARYVGLDFELCPVDLLHGAQLTPEFTALNPNQKMPVLEEDGFVLWESNAIMQYLAGRKPQSGLLPSDERGRLDVTRWQFWDVAHWDSPVETLLLENFIKPRFLGVTERDDAAVAKATEHFHRAAAVLDGQLKGRRYVIGDTLTVADFSLGAPLNYATQARFPLEPYGEIRRWHASLMTLPAWQKTMAQGALPAAAAA